MIKDRIIICIASSWDLDPTSKHHVMRLLAHDNRILWVNYHGTRRPTLSTRDLQSIRSALSRALRGPQAINDHMVQMTPMLIPALDGGLCGRLNRHAIVSQIKSALRTFRKGCQWPVQVWSFAPDVAYLAGQFDEECFVYYCVDEYAQFDGFDGPTMRAAEQRTLRAADVVFASSMALFDCKRDRHPNVHLVRHGVDYDHFAAAARPDATVARELRPLRKPIIGFFGLVHHWIDVELIDRIATSMPDANVVLIGEVFANVDALKARHNVHLLGRRPYESLPAFCAGFDVALLPFKCNQMTRFVNPIKLREYLAAGLPVVSTPIPEAALFEPQITIAREPEAFIDACRRAMTQTDPHERRRRSRSMADQSWRGVVARLGRIVTETMNNKHGREFSQAGSRDHAATSVIQAAAAAATAVY